MQISPSLAIWLNIIYAVISGLSIPTLNALGFSASASVILAWAGLIGVVLNAVLHAFSSSVPGPLAPPDSDAVKKAMAAAAKAIAIFVLVPAFALALLLHAGPASADTIHKMKAPNGRNPTPAVDPSVITSPGGKVPTSTDTGGVLNLLVAVQQQFIADVTTADGLASTPLPIQTAALCPAPATWDSTAKTCSTPEIWDPLAHLCFPALIGFVQTLPGPQALPQAPTGAGGPVTVFEDARIGVRATEMAISQIAAIGYPDSLKIACGPLVLDAQNEVGKIALGAVGINALILKFIPGA